MLTDELNLILGGLHLTERPFAMTTSAMLQGVRQFMNQNRDRQDPRFQFNSTGRRGVASTGTTVRVPIRARSRSNTQQNVRAIKAMRVALVVSTGAAASTPTDRRGCQRGALIGGELVAGCYEFNSRFVNICAELRGEARTSGSARGRDGACTSHQARAG